MTVRAAHQWSDAAAALCRSTSRSLASFGMASLPDVQPGDLGQHQGMQGSSPAEACAQPVKQRRLQPTAAPALAAAWQALAAAAAGRSQGAMRRQEALPSNSSGSSGCQASFWSALARVCHVDGQTDRLPREPDVWAARLAAAASEASDTPGASCSGAMAVPCVLAALECLQRALLLMQACRTCCNSAACPAGAEPVFCSSLMRQAHQSSAQVVYGKAHGAVDRCSFLPCTHLPYPLAATMIQAVSRAQPAAAAPVDLLRQALEPVT